MGGAGAEGEASDDGRALCGVNGLAVAPPLCEGTLPCPPVHGRAGQVLEAVEAARQVGVLVLKLPRHGLGFADDLEDSEIVENECWNG